MTARRAGEGERMLRAGQWQGWHPTQMLGQHVTGKTVGIIGMGRIGQATARRCHYGFGMTVIFHNRSPLADAGLPATQVPLATAMAADFVVVAVPGSPATRHLINAVTLSQMAPHGIFVNISRGDVVDLSLIHIYLVTAQSGKRCTLPGTQPLVGSVPVEALL